MRLLSSVGVAGLVLVAGCPETNVIGDDVGPVDALVADDAPTLPDARARDDARRPDAGAPSCEGEACRIVEVQLGGETTCARRRNGEVLCWGRGQDGELGDGETRHLPGCVRSGDSTLTDCSDTPVRVNLPFAARALHGWGGFSLCADDGAGTYACWGSWGYELLAGGNETRFAPEVASHYAGATSLSDAYLHACWLEGSSAVCLGGNWVGQLGRGDFDVVRSPVRPRLESGGELTGLLEVRTSVMFGGHTCARSATSLYCWGTNSRGQLGDGATHALCAGDGVDRFDCSPWAVDTRYARASEIRTLALGADFSCALHTDGTVACWGQNVTGQLGLGTPTALDVLPRVVPTLLPGMTGIREIAPGARHTCVLRDSGRVACWGSNDAGQLGDGMDDHGQQCMLGDSLIDCTSSPVEVVGVNGAISLVAGRQHTCALLPDGELRCWGMNDKHQIRAGDRDPVYTPHPIRL